jgi:superfamily I DNA/RNA helicase
MARILPDPLVGSFASEVLKVHRALKAIPGEEFMVWVGLPLPGRNEYPDFLVVHNNSTAFVIAVGGVTETDLDENLHGSLFSGEMARPPSAAETGALLRQRVRTFIETALTQHTTGDSAVPGPPAVYGLVLFPQAPHEKLRQLWGQNPLDDCYWLGEEHVTADKLALCLRKLATGGLKERHLARLRSHFSPEAVVPPRLSTRAPRRRNVAAEYTPLLLDYDQEAWAKNRLRLSDEAAAAAEEQGPYGEASLVTGVAGSGKSLVLLFRACTQAQLDPQSRTLVITHNKALRRELEIRFGELGRPPNIEWHTFFSWAETGLSSLAGGRRKMAEYGGRDELLAQAIRAEGGKVTGQWVEFVRDEIDWMQDRGVTMLEEYLAVDRVGRGMRLNAEQRRALHAVYRRYLELLASRQEEDWSGRALRFWQEIERGKIRLPYFDYIYVDEAQFFAPVWLRALRSALKPGSGRLLLAADPTQGFLKRRQSWVACGLDIRGRSTRLRRSYRNTRPILTLAAEFYRSRMKDEEETDLNLPDEMELASADPGEEPRLVILTSRQDEVGRVINELKSYLAEGGDPEAVLVLVASGQRTKGVHDELARTLGTHRVGDARKSAVMHAVRVCSIDAATGLEAPIVFLIGAAELLEKESDLQMALEQREELRRDNTRRLYMAFTRAGMRLFITWVGQVPDILQSRLSDL